MNPDFAFRNRKALEVDNLLRRHFAKENISLEEIGRQVYKLSDGRQLAFYYATGNPWFSPYAEQINQEFAPTDLIVFAYTDEEEAKLWLFGVPVEALRTYVRQAGLEPSLDQGKKYSLNLISENGRFRFRQITLPLEQYQIASELTRLTRALVGLADAPDNLLTSTGLESHKLKRLLRWRIEGDEEQGEQFNFADVRRRLKAIQPLLQLFVETPDEFTAANWQTVLDTMYLASPQKPHILANNSLDDIRQALLALFKSEQSLNKRLEQVQLSNVGPAIKAELLTWFEPESYPLNSRAAQAGLRYFGFEPGPDYESFVSAFANFRRIYEQAIGHLQSDLPLNLEIDQFLNQVYHLDLTGGGKRVDPQVAKEAYWRITLPAQGDRPVWQTCLEKGLAVIGFRHEDDTDPQIKMFASIKPGDWVVAFLREKRIGGIGRVVAPYDPTTVENISPEQDYWNGDFRRRIKVEWYPQEISVDNLPPQTQNRFGQRTIVTLTPAQFADVKQFYDDVITQDGKDGDDQIEPQVAYTVEDFVRNTYQADDRWYLEVTELLRDKGQIILYGPPGTGKTFMARELAKALVGTSEPGPERYELIQFHPAYSYEEFIEGIRPESRTVDEGEVKRRIVDYPVRRGVFKEFCQNAEKQNGPCVFVIDEINRGNIASIFGELMYALEYRDQSAPVVLPYSGDPFTIPKNVCIIGTMNTADRSISLMDFALRRRFHFIRCPADPNILARWFENIQPAVPYLLLLYRKLLDEIEEPDYQIGVSYFMDKALTEERLGRVWRRSIEPYLETYFIDEPDRYNPLRWDSPELTALRQKKSGN